MAAFASRNMNQSPHSYLPLLLGLLFLLVLARVFPLHALSGLSTYLPLHMLLETLSLIVSAMIFVVGWTAYSEVRLRAVVLLATVFAGVVLLDFSHVLSFVGMPEYFTENTHGKAINFWLAARFYAASGLLALALMSWRTVSQLRLRLLFLSVSLGLVLLLHMLFLLTPEVVPETYVEGRGLTAAKLLAEYFIIAMHVLTAVLIWRRREQAGPLDVGALLASVCVMGMSELLFTFYAEFTDSYNLLGHVYKVIAYMLLYKALVFSAIIAPFQQVTGLQKRLKATLDALPDLMFEVDSKGVIHNFHSSYARLLASPEEFLGRSMFNFLPQDVSRVMEEAISDIAKTGMSKGRQYSLKMPDGLFHYEISGRRVDDSDSLAGHAVLLVRDITERRLEEQRTQSLLELALIDKSIDEKVMARMALDQIEVITGSRISFLHLVSEDQEQIELLAWSSATLSSYCHIGHETHYPVSKAGIWADCIRSKQPVIINDYPAVGKPGNLPQGHAELSRLISVPVIQDGLVRMVVGVGNADHEYNNTEVKTIQLLSNEMYRIILNRRIEQELLRSKEFIQAALDNLPIGVAMNTVGEKVDFEYMNERFAEIYGTTTARLRDSSDFWQQVYEDPEFRDKIKAQVLADSSSGDLQLMKWENVPITRDGQIVRYVTAQNIPLPEEHLVLSLATDVTEQVNAQRELTIAATAFESQESIMITDAQQRILRVNKSFTESTGYTEAEVKGKTPSILQSGRHDAHFYEEMWEILRANGAWRGEIWNRRKNGELYPQKILITAVRNELGETTHYVADFIDITQIKQAEDRIRQLAFYDPLTGLANRQMLLEQLQAVIDGIDEKGKYGALLFIDLDQFKLINDTQGHDFGDQFLIQVAGRLNDLAIPNSFLARNGSDEFIMLVTDLDSDASVAAQLSQMVAEKLLKGTTLPFEIKQSQYFITCSVGVSMFGPTGISALEALKQADIATNLAKENGRNQVSFFDPQMQELISTRVTLERALRSALSENQFVLYFQPQTDAQGNILGAEALIRWQHPERGLLTPAEFIPLAEETGHILAISDWVAETAILTLKTWQDKLPDPIPTISINLNSEQFHSPGLAAGIKALLEKYQVSPRHLVLELTESILLEGFETASQNLQALQSIGVHFSIDDFGTGYSSLSYLSQLPVNELKIDKSFVQNMIDSEADASIVRAIIEMSHALNRRVLAEGVETEEQLRMLKSLGCDLYQGYLFSRPVPVAEFEALLTR